MWSSESSNPGTGQDSGAASHVAEVLGATDRYVAHNHHPLDIVVFEGHGATVIDTGGREYLDFLAGYSALNFGHGHPVILQAARRQLEKVTLTSRAFHNDQLGPFAQQLCELVGKEMMLPMNTGAEAVESAIKVARKWGYERKGVRPEKANIIVAEGNFHGRTTTIVGFSDDPDARSNYGPYTPGFRTAPYGDVGALEAAIDSNTVAVLLEPIQGEAGVVVPPAGYLPEVRSLTESLNVLFIADEIQSGLGRTGATLACEHESVVPDMYLLGKALGGGVLPVSAVVADANVLGVLQPGQHGSTFGGNPLACAVGSSVVGLLRDGHYQQRAVSLGKTLHAGLLQLRSMGVTAVRGRGLWAGVDVDPTLGSGRQVCQRLAGYGILAKETHGSTVRLAPPLVATGAEIARGVEALAAVLEDLAA